MSDLARAAIRRLRTGVVPNWELAHLSVGYDRVKTLVEQSLGALGRDGKSSPLFARGEWGTGKSHFLSYVGTTAAAAGGSPARTDRSQREGRCAQSPSAFSYRSSQTAFMLATMSAYRISFRD